MVRSDERDQRRMQEVSCRRCGTPVAVRKNSAAQTSVQWLSDAGETCPELAARRAAGESSGRVSTCESLRSSIERAVQDGTVEVGDA